MLSVCSEDVDAQHPVSFGEGYGRFFCQSMNKAKDSVTKYSSQYFFTDHCHDDPCPDSQTRDSNREVGQGHG